MITSQMIDDYIDKIPPVPATLRKTILLLNASKLTEAAHVAQEDLALRAYLKNLVNKPVYGFRNEVSDLSQIFGILGVSGAQQSVYNYAMSLLSPKRWIFFDLNATKFQNLQAELSGNWKKILTYLKIEDKEIESAITLLPASLIVSEALFHQKKDDVELLRSASNIDLNTILQRLCHRDLFDICEQIALKWELGENIIAIVQASSGVKPSPNVQINTLAKWMHLLLFYTLSKPIFIEARLNDFIDFQIDYVSDIYEEFSKLLEIS